MDIISSTGSKLGAFVLIPREHSIPVVGEAGKKKNEPDSKQDPGVILPKDHYDKNYGNQQDPHHGQVVGSDPPGKEGKHFRIRGLLNEQKGLNY